MVFQGVETNANSDVPEASSPPILTVDNLVQEFHVRGKTGITGVLHAVSGVSLEIRRGEALGVVGETGCGKSTLARSIMQSPPPRSGSVILDDTDLTTLHARQLREARRAMQMIFQDPFSSLDPTWRVRDIITEPLAGFNVGGSKADRERRAMELLELVGLRPSQFATRRPKTLSGGQAQRVAIARALSVSPALLICDEPVSSLDVLIQAQILNLFDDLRRELGVAYLFISHDLGTVQYVCDRVAVMYLGRFCEVGAANELYSNPLHPYTAALLASRPIATSKGESTRKAALTSAEVPSALDPPSGCRFRTRCPRARQLCASEVPAMRELRPGHQVACHYPLSEDPEASSTDPSLLIDR
jgi:oligopeptide/dipeptide ABC transporter ATP-binding protein